MPRIAIIDDDVYIGNMLEEVLTKEGYLVSRAYSGTEAVLLLNNSLELPDLILLDLMQVYYLIVSTQLKRGKIQQDLVCQ